MRKILSVLIASFMLSGCLSPVKTVPINKYILNKLPDCVASKKLRPNILLVAMPSTKPIYNTTQMAYTIRPWQIAYFALNQWAETPSQMFQPLLVQTMEKTHHFKAIVTAPYSGNYDYELNTEILTLLQDYTCKRPVLMMTVRAQMIKTSSNRVIGSREFAVIQALPQSSPYGGVIAGNMASKKILGEIAEFCLEHTP